MRPKTRVNDGNAPVSYTLLSLPLHLVGELPRILGEIRMDKATEGRTLPVDGEIIL